MGLSTAEATKRLRHFGYNRLAEERVPHPLWVFVRQFHSPLIYLLLGASVVAGIFGSAKDPCVIGVVLVLNSLIGTFHELRAQKSLTALKKLAMQSSRVMRDGAWKVVSSEELVPGDLVQLDAGDRVPADVRVKATERLSVDESILTGESLALEKGVGEELFAGSSVLVGRAEVEVAVTGVHTRLASIAQLTQEAKPPKTPLEERVDRLGHHLLMLSLALFAVLMGVGWWRGVEIEQMLLAAVSVVVSIVPEGLPVAITIALAAGVQRMASSKSIVRKLAAVETLGSCDVICTDKTGTLTQNRMEVKQLVLPDGTKLEAPTTQAAQRLVQMAAAVCDRVDPMERAILDFADHWKIDYRLKRSKEVPFDPATRMTVTHLEDGRVIAKGAPESIAPEFTLESTAFRMIGVSDKGQLLGFICLYDPPREGVVKAVRECFSAGITPIMITGDHLVTAEAIGAEVGIKEVYARIHPEEKLRIVEKLQAKGCVVAMTGDGVNDAPALAKADVGVAMGSGSDVAKESAKMVLLDDSFTTLVRAVQQGRLVFNNIQLVVFFILTASLPTALLVFLSLAMGLPLPLTAPQILWINVVAEGTLTIGLVLEPPTGNELRVPPKKRNHPILDRTYLKAMLWKIPLTTAILFSYMQVHPGEQAQLFTLLALTAWFVLLTCVRSFRNPYLFGGLVAGVLLQLVVLYTPALQPLFDTQPLTFNTWVELVFWASPVLIIGSCFSMRKRA